MLTSSRAGTDLLPSTPRRSIASATLLGVVLGACLVAVVLLSLGVGSRFVPLSEVWTALTTGGDGPASIIVHELRIPRTATAVMVGAALGVAGLLMQASTRNPLADPGLLGVNAGASAAVVVAIGFLGIGTASGYVWFAFLGAAGAAALVHLVGRARSRDDAVGVVLAGIALTACLSAFVGIVTLLDEDTFESYRLWVVGSFERRDLDMTGQLAPFVVVGFVVAALVAPGLNQLALGDDTARALGVRPVAVTLGTGLAVTLLCGAATAAAGPLSFIGLLVAHAVRRVVGPDLRLTLPLAVLAGSVLTVSSDVAGRLITYPGEVEAGIVAAFLGAPVLLWLVIRRMR